jgi:hypothetical protein
MMEIEIPDYKMFQGVARVALEELNINGKLLDIRRDPESDRKTLSFQTDKQREIEVTILPDGTGSHERLKEIIKGALIERDPTILDD